MIDFTPLLILHDQADGLDRGVVLSANFRVGQQSCCCIGADAARDLHAEFGVRSTANILSVGRRLQMVGSNACLHLTQVVGFFVRVNRPIGGFVEHAMGSTAADHAVAVFQLALPDPAWRNEASVFDAIVRAKIFPTVTENESERLILDPPFTGVGAGGQAGAFATSALAKAARNDAIVQGHCGPPIRGARLPAGATVREPLLASIVPPSVGPTWGKQGRCYMAGETLYRLIDREDREASTPIEVRPKA